MIENERQYRITREQAEKFERALQQLARHPLDGVTDPRFREIEVAGLQGQLDDLRAQLAEYEARSRFRQVLLAAVAVLRNLGDSVSRRSASG